MNAAVALMQLARVSPHPPKQRGDKTARSDLAAALLEAVLHPAGGAAASTPRDASSALWALAKMGLPPTTAELLQLLDVVAAELTAAAAVAAAAAGSAAAGRLSSTPATAQDASMAIWAVATVAASPSPPRLQLQDLNPLLKLILTKLDGAAPQALSNVVWGLATVRLAVLQDSTPGDEWPPRAWLQRFEARAALDLWAHTPLGLYNLLWGLAKLRWTPDPAFLRTACTAVASCAGQASPQAASGALWALASLRASPGDRFFREWHAATRTAVQSTWGPQDIASGLWAHAVLGQRPPPDWLSCALARCRAGMGGCNQIELATTLWACARLGAAPHAEWMAAWMLAYARRALDAPLAPTLPCAAYSMALLRFRPPLEWAGRLVAEAAHQMECMGPQQLANLVWALARLQLVPTTAWLQRFLDQVCLVCVCVCVPCGWLMAAGLSVSVRHHHTSLTHSTHGNNPPSTAPPQRQAIVTADAFDSQELSNMIWALAVLQPQRPPPRGWLATLLAHWRVEEGVEAEMAAREVSMLLWALGRWGLHRQKDG